MKNILSKFIIVSMVVGFAAMVGCGNQEEEQGGAATIESLQLGELYVHTFEDKGFAVAYPSDWVEVNTSSSSGITIRCDNLCLDKPLIMGVVRPGNISSMDSQSYINGLISMHTQTVGSSPISRETITIGGKPVVIVVYRYVHSEEGEETLEINHYFISDDSSKESMIMAFCGPDCWEYYEDAVYAITASYQFLD